MRRYALRDDQWDRIKDTLPGRDGHVGGTAPDNRLFVEAVLFRFRAGVPWRDLPDGRRAAFAAVAARIHKINSANWARDLGVPTHVFAACKVILDVQVLHALTKEIFHGHAVFDPYKISFVLQTKKSRNLWASRLSHIQKDG